MPKLSKLRDKAIRLLARREHAALELRQKLQGLGDDTEIEALIDRLVAEGLQSNERFTESYIRARQNAGYGFLRIQQELVQRGIDAELIEQHLSNDPDHWQALLHQVWQKKYDGVIPNSDKAYAQQARFLLQRGFAAEMIYRFLTKI